MHLSLRSKINSNLSIKIAFILAGLTLISVLFYLISSHFYFRNGFPLDDAWIFQTYARNLARSGQWSFNVGQISGGSTSPLWTILVSIGYLIQLPTLFWAYLMGSLFLWGTGFLGERMFCRMLTSYNPGFPWVGSLIILEWHLSWSSVSGMETIAYTFLVMIVAYELIKPEPHFFRIGTLIGLSTWMRPDGLLLIIPVSLFILLNPHNSVSQKFKKEIIFIIGFLLLFMPYLVFNKTISGSFWPTTFYAKQAEYASYLKSSYFIRFGAFSFQLLAGIGFILLPGLLLHLWQTIKNKNWLPLIFTIWVVSYIGIYAGKLPAIYQHGRYIIPTIPIFILFGFSGFWTFIHSFTSKGKWVLKNAWMISLVIVTFYFWAQGAIVYSRDVTFIESEMVATANWVNDHVPANSIVAVHDIGAMGFFGGHKLVDLAGLISPQVIPFISNELRLAEYLDHERVNYLVVFPDWYKNLNKGLGIVYSTHSVFSEKFGWQNLTVYAWAK